MTKKTRKTHKMRKVLLTVCCAALLVCVTIGATVAYLTSTATVENTFTVGNVKITLDEALVDANGKKIEGDGAGRTTEANNKQSYHVFPGGSYDKDPTVHVAVNSEEAYIRMKVTVSDIASLKDAFPQATYSDYYMVDGTFLLEKLVSGWQSAVWPCQGCTLNSDGSATYEFRYHTTVAGNKGESATVKDLEALFTDVNIPGTVDNNALANLNNIKIIVTAEAIQADGFQTADLAWAEFPTT